MKGFSDHSLDEDAFGEKGNIVSAFDAFPKSKPEYVTRTSGGGKWTVAMLFVSSFLIFSEFARWWRGYENHAVAVEKGVNHDMQINLDIVVAMQCPNIHINVQDAAGDRILAGEVLTKAPTNWFQWADNHGVRKLGRDAEGHVVTGEGYQEEGFGEEHVHDIIAAADVGRRAKFGKTPRLRGAGEGDSCRIFGSLYVNKVQGDFHITARGHGYQEWGAAHLDHTAFNFSHIISELSFGAFYPSLLNPLDHTIATTPNHFHKFQYFVSVVPTVYTVGSNPAKGNTIFTNQYAVTEQSYIVGERSVPGLFFKYDIEPMMLTVEEIRDSFLRFMIKVVNVLSGVLVAGHWGSTLTAWAITVLGNRRRKMSDGVLNGRAHENDE
ncbi:Uncharacterized protein BP5553_03493 [Venustampulla echinocandica]|uniref:Endoplasmic reticulum-Golgi intermediate compartment protein n=1 Tax=Venustampulla echinocandica TaxID=2656787 RepID=A0A370TUE1_9HELO|nr:Uncharacterized protein BP5553_03493 [Venustampulla echinocandica]RDL39153.1 Uncharacterized protein BP5553_03493 [Venustampulla echinocandica]